MKTNIRRSVVSGTFYPGNPNQLEKDLSNRIKLVKNKQKVISLISPHAGYMYSGDCAGKGFGAVEVPDRVIVIGVDHSGMGYPFAVDGFDMWDMPLGQVEIDSELRDDLLRDSKVFKIDNQSGLNEHSVEVQVPFLQYLNPKAKILPILISSINYAELELGGIEIAELIKKHNNKNILIVASTDMSHYISASNAKEKDSMAIEKIDKLDPSGLLNTVITERITMCGVSPVVISIVASKELGGDKAALIEYTNSGEVSGDYNQVVGYLSMTISKE